MISIILPVFNGEQYLDQTVKYLLNQSFSDFEAIFVDDFSCDNSFKILQNYSQKDSRIKVFKNKIKGTGQARNYGITLSKGQFIIFLDSDDEFHTDLLAELYNSIGDSDISMCYFQSVKNNEIMWTHKIDNLNFNSIDPVFYPPFCWNKLYNKDFLIRNNLKFMNTKTSNDVAFVFLSLVLANKIEIVRKILIKYIQREFSLTRTRSIDNFSDVEVYKFIKKELKKRKMFNQVKHLYYQLMYKSYSDALNLSADANKNQLYAKIKTYLPPEFFIYLKKYATYKELKKFIKLKFYPFSFILIGVYKQTLQFFTHKKTKSNNLEN